MQNLAAALVVAQANARSVAKDKTNEYHRYPYASAESMIDEGRQSLSYAGLALMSAGRSFVAAEAVAGDKAPIGRVCIKYKLVHSSGEALDFESSTSVIPEKGRPADKAEAAAVTSDLAYTIRGLLLLTRGLEDGSIDGRDDRQYDRRPPENDRAPSEPRPAPSRAGDHAAAAQTGVEQHRGEPVRSGEPVRDPAHVAMARDFEARVATAPDLTSLYEEITKSALPADMKRAPILAIVLRVFGLVDNVDDLNAWGSIAGKAKLGELYRAQLDAGYDAALVRLGRMVPPIAAE